MVDLHDRLTLVECHALAGRPDEAFEWLEHMMRTGATPYPCVSGKPPVPYTALVMELVEGESISHVLAAVLKDEPDWAALPPLAAILAVVALTFATRAFMAPAAETSTARFLVAPPDGLMFHSNNFGRGGWGSPLVVSPDGQRIALVLADGEGTQRPWMRTLDATAPRLLAGTEGASSPFWSPDSRWIAFFSQGKLKRIATAGGETQILCVQEPAEAEPGAVMT